MIYKFIYIYIYIYDDDDDDDDDDLVVGQMKVIAYMCR
jgi:hypothetical protein